MLRTRNTLMASFEFEIRTDPGPEIYVTRLPFAEAEFARVIEWAQRTYANADGSLPPPDVAWARAATATANILLERAYEMHRNIEAAGVPPPTIIVAPSEESKESSP